MAKKSSKTAADTPDATALSPQVPGPATHPSAPAVSKFQGFTITRVHRSQIQPATYNPRTIDPHSRKRLRENLRTNTLVEPLVWNPNNGILIGGHQRLSVLDELEGSQDYYLDVSAVPIDDPAREQALNIALNNPALQGNFDMQMLESLVIQPDFPLKKTGFDIAELQLMDGFSPEALAQLDGGGTFGQQALAEAPILQQFSEIAQVSKEVEKRESGEKDGQQQANQQGQQSQQPADLFADPAATSGATAHAAGQQPPTASPFPQANSPASQSQTQQQKSDAELARLKSERIRYSSQEGGGYETEFYFVAVFNSTQALDRFWAYVNIPVDQRNINGEALCDRIADAYKRARKAIEVGGKAGGMAVLEAEIAKLKKISDGG